MSSEARLSCEICHKKFKFSSTYKIHVNKHTRASRKRLDCDKTPKSTLKSKTDHQLLVFTETVAGAQNSQDLKQPNKDEENLISQAGKIQINETAGEDLEKNLIGKTNDTNCIQSKDHAHAKTVENLSIDVNMENENREHFDQQNVFSQEFLASEGAASARQSDCKTVKKGKLRKRSSRIKDNSTNYKTGHKGKHKKEKVDQIFACTICKKVFSNKQNLVAHKNKHLGVRHKCDQCGLTYSSKYSLKTHLLWHKNLKPWECEQCGAQFLQNGHFKRHLKIHSGQKDEICEQCGKSFPGRDGLRAHKQTHINHAGYECHICGVKLKLKSSLRNHMKIHKEAKEYTCNVCKRSFSQKKCYLNHKKLHNSTYVKRKAYLKPLQESCELCHKGFVNRSGLKKHLRKHELGLLKRFNSLNLQESQKIPDDVAMRNVSKHGNSCPSVKTFEEGNHEQSDISPAVFDTENVDGYNPGNVRHKVERGGRFEKPFDQNAQRKTPDVNEIKQKDPVKQTKSGFIMSNTGPSPRAKVAITPCIHGVNATLTCKDGTGLGILKTNKGVNEMLVNQSTKSTSNLCNPDTDLVLDNPEHTDTKIMNSGTEAGIGQPLGYVMPNNPMGYSTSISHAERILYLSETNTRHRVDISEHAKSSDRGSGCLHTDTIKLDGLQGNYTVAPTEQLEERVYQRTEGGGECLLYVLQKCNLLKENINTDRFVQIEQSISETEKLGIDVTPSHPKNSLYKSCDIPEATLGKETSSNPNFIVQNCEQNESKNYVQEEGFSREKHGTVQLQVVGNVDDRLSSASKMLLNGPLRTNDSCYENFSLKTNAKGTSDTFKTPLNTLVLGSNKCHGLLEQAGVSHELENERETKHKLSAAQNSYRNVVNHDTDSTDSTEEGTDQLSDTEAAEPTDKTIKNLPCTQQDEENTRMELSQAGNSGIQSVSSREALNPKKNCRKKHKMMSSPTHPKSICEHCGKTFSQTNHLYRHIRLRSCLKRYECSLCCRAFRSGGSLLKHMRKDHNMRFVCNRCDKSFASSSSLRKHEKYHVNDSPYLYVPKLFECKICGNRYTASSSLKTHLLQHKGYTFTCNFCGKEYGQKSHLARHISTVHHGIKHYKCDIKGCGKGFVDSRALQVHKRSHSGEKPYQCNTCGKFFTESQNLKVHMKKHLNVKEFKCDICEQEFTTKMSMLRHLKRHEKTAKDNGQSSSGKCSVKKMAEKTLCCSHECGSRFTTRRALVAHMKKHCPLKNSIRADNSVPRQVQNVL